MKRLLLWLIHLYQKWVSPLFPPSCRYSPTCSAYAVTAIQIHGALLGMIMGVARIIRCNPLVKGGYDPVPHSFTIFRNKRAQAEYRRSMNLK